MHPTTRLSVHLFVGSSERGWRWRNRRTCARLGGCSRLVEGPMIETSRSQPNRMAPRPLLRSLVNLRGTRPAFSARPSLPYPPSWLGAPCLANLASVWFDFLRARGFGCVVSQRPGAQYSLGHACFTDSTHTRADIGMFSLPRYTLAWRVIEITRDV